MRNAGHGNRKFPRVFPAFTFSYNAKLTNIALIKAKIFILIYLSLYQNTTR